MKKFHRGKKTQIKKGSNETTIHICTLEHQKRLEKTNFINCCYFKRKKTKTKRQIIMNLDNLWKLDSFSTVCISGRGKLQNIYKIREPTACSYLHWIQIEEIYVHEFYLQNLRKNPTCKTTNWLETKCRHGIWHLTTNDRTLIATIRTVRMAVAFFRNIHTSTTCYAFELFAF